MSNLCRFVVAFHELPEVARHKGKLDGIAERPRYVVVLRDELDWGLHDSSLKRVNNLCNRIEKYLTIG